MTGPSAFRSLRRRRAREAWLLAGLAVVVVAGVALSQSCPAASSVPDDDACVYADGGSECAPGEFDPSLEVATLCTEGQSRRCKPSVALKRAIARRWGVARCGEVDHVYPLSLGGTNGLRNLQCQPAPDWRRKDVVEDAAWRGVCSGRLSLDAARAMVKDWVQSYRSRKDVVVQSYRRMKQ